MRKLLTALFLVVCAYAPADAQSVSTSQIGGVVRDESGGTLPGVTVTATQTDTGLRRVVVSDETRDTAAQREPSISPVASKEPAHAAP